jgi:hypothetical protein
LKHAHGKYSLTNEAMDEPVEIENPDDSVNEEWEDVIIGWVRI